MSDSRLLSFIFPLLSRIHFLLLPACLGLTGLAASPGPWKGLSHLAPDSPPVNLPDALQNRDVVYFRSCLSPGILIRMKSSSFEAFTGLDKYGAEVPSFFVVKTAEGTRAMDRGESIKGDQMTASWIAASFQGCKGWEQFDVPWYFSLEKRPDEIRLTNDGLVISFPTKDSGYVFSMPLYGYYKPPQESDNFAAQHNLPSPGICPWNWKEKPPDKFVHRCDWWAEVAKAYPIGFQESFSVDPSTDEIRFRQDYRWLTYQDDWATLPKRFATLSPSLGLAWKSPGFPVEFSAPIHDPGYFTSFGPYVGAEDVDRLEIRMRVLQYTNEMEYLEPPALPGSHHREALKLIISGMQNKFRSASRYQYDHGGEENFCWNIVGDVWYPRALPYLPAGLKQTARSSLRLYMQEDVLRSHRPHKDKYVLVGPGIDSFGEWGDAGKFMTNALQAIWAYG